LPSTSCRRILLLPKGFDHVNSTDPALAPPTIGVAGSPIGRQGCAGKRAAIGSADLMCSLSQRRSAIVSRPLDPSALPGLSIAHLTPFQRSYSPPNRVPESE